MIEKMKVAIVHDYIKEYGGAERVLEALHELYPDAPIFTSVYLPEFLGPHRDRFKKWHIVTSWAQHVPFKSKLISPFRLLAPFLFQSFDFSEYDVVIVSATGAYCSNFIAIKKNQSQVTDDKERNNKPSAMSHKQIHICYCHTPPRYLYGYATAREWKNNIFLRILGETANYFLRIVDFKAAQRVDYFIANSEEVCTRIKKFYRRDATVIYPPVNVNSKLEIRNSIVPHNKSYFLAGGRLARAKHMDFIVRACKELNIPLKIFGRGFAGYEKELDGVNPSEGSNESIEFVGEVTDSEKMDLMRGAKGYIFASEDEDFGITPVEAMSVGTPVIAYRSGGVLETVIDGKTGVFFDKLSVESFQKAITYYNTIYHQSIKKEECIKQAQKFSKERFLQEIQEYIKSASENVI